jgi:hypothetical protein
VSKRGPTPDGRESRRETERSDLSLLISNAGTPQLTSTATTRGPKFGSLWKRRIVLDSLARGRHGLGGGQCKARCTRAGERIREQFRSVGWLGEERASVDGGGRESGQASGGGRRPSPPPPISPQGPGAHNNAISILPVGGDHVCARARPRRDGRGGAKGDMSHPRADRTRASN